MLSGTARNDRPARFRDVFASSEFRAVYVASALSWLGDYIAKAAITALVFELTGSVAVSAIAFAISFAPWLLGGSVLVSIAERYPYRTVMVVCDVARMAIMAVVALVTLPMPAVLALVLASAMFTPPFDAARSATVAHILPDDRYVVGAALYTSSGPPAQVAGYFLGASLAAVSPRLALLVNAATFAISAMFVRFAVRRREAALAQSRRTHLLHETGEGFRLVFGTPALRALVLLVFAGSMVAIVPEGLGAAWAARQAGALDVGYAQGLIMSAAPLGSILGALIVTRLISPPVRVRLLRPLGLVTALVLVPVALDPPIQVAAALAGICGLAMGGLVPVANGQFVQSLPNGYRARAFGVVQAGLHLLQGGAVLATGALAAHASLPMVVGLWSTAGVVLMALLSLSWPSREVFAQAQTAAAVANEVPAPRGVAAPEQPRRGLLAVMDAARRRGGAGQPGTMEP